MGVVNVEIEVGGIIRKIEAKVGAKVAQKDVLLIAECMKMEVPIESPCDGVIKEIRVKEGENVNKRTEVIVIEV